MSTYKICSHKFNSYVEKHDDIGDVVKIPRSYKNKFNGDNIKTDKNIRAKMRDSRYSHKNRRKVNKDWKDFNNMQ
jgi:hypothetical protein